MSRHPQTKWAQRYDKVFITIELPDAKNVKLALQPEGHFNFSATAGADNIPYELEFDLYDKVNVGESKAALGLRNICYLVKKAENKWWGRLLKQEGKAPVYLKVDWDKWVDEDDEKENSFGNSEFGDMEFSNLNMGDGPDGDDGFGYGPYISDEDEDDDIEEIKSDEVSADKESGAPTITNAAAASSATD